MDDETETFAALIALAFHEGAAEDANTLIFQVRQHLMEQFGDAANYEVMLDGRPHGYMVDSLAPRLALYLKSKRLSVAACGPVFLSVFIGRKLYFVAAQDFFGYAQALLGLEDAPFAALAENWERSGRSAVAAPPSGEPPDA